VPSLGLIRTRKHWGRLRFVLALQIAAAAGVPLIGSPPAVGRTGVAVEAENYDEMFRQAKNLFVEKRYRESLKVLERCLALNHQDPETYKLVASNAILIDRMDIAEQALKTAQQLTPDDYAVLFNLGALYYTESRFLQAQPELEKSVKLNSHYVPARLFLGLTQEELGQEAAAIATYLKSIEIAEHSGFQGEQPYLYLGRLMYRQNNVIESLPYLQKAAQANPQSCESPEFPRAGVTGHGGREPVPECGPRLPRGSLPPQSRLRPARRRGKIRRGVDALSRAEEKRAEQKRPAQKPARHPIKYYGATLPTHASRLKQGEIWLSILTRQARRDASFALPPQVREAIDRFQGVSNAQAGADPPW